MRAFSQRLFPYKSLSWWTLIGLFFFILFLALNYGAPLPLSWDTMGYYAYLSEYFVDGDLLIEDLSHYQYIMDTYDNTGSLYQFIPVETGGFITKYTSGWAILNSPFMFTAHWYAGWQGFPQDGFSTPYQIANLIGSLFYTLLGLLLMRKVLLEFASEKIVALMLVLLVLATNYLHMNYSCIGLVHVYLFPLYALLLLLTIKFYKKKSTLLSIAIGATIGLMILVRPTEAIAVLIPLLYGIIDYQSLRNRIKDFFTTKHYYIAIIFMVGVYSIQMIYWKLTTGDFLFYTYTNPAEGLDFDKPNILNVLFSFRKGWFIYTPLMLLMILGFVNIFRTKRVIFWPLLAFTMINLYVVSCWSVWWYTGSFSNRALEHSYPIYILVIAFAFVGLSQLKRILLLSCAGVPLILNLFQTWQIQNGILHLSNMSKDYYFSVFGQTSAPTLEQKELLLIDRGLSSFENPEKYNLIQTVSADFELPMYLSEKEPYTPLILTNYETLTQTDHLWIVAKAEIELALQDSISSKQEFATHLCVNMRYQEQNYAWTNSTLTDIGSNSVLLVKEYLTPDLRTKQDEIAVGVWHQFGPAVKITDLYFEVYEHK